MKKETSSEILKGWKRRIPLIAVLVFLASSLGYVMRPLWFDEVITADWLSLPLAEIPFRYRIPNNHIVYTVLLKIWQDLLLLSGMNGIWGLRVLSLIFGILAVWIISGRLLKAGGIFPALSVSILLAGSGAFRLYGTAIRGYMPGILFSFASFLMAEKFLKTDWKWYFLFFMVFACLAVGTIPSNVLAVGIGILFLFPFVFRKKAGKTALLLLGAFCSVWISYLHVLDQFLANTKLAEGWSSIFNSSVNVYLSFAFFFLPVLPFAAWGFLRLARRRCVRFRLLCFAGIFAVPPVISLFFRVPPFPRIFFAFFAVWVLILGYGLSAFMHGKGIWRKAVPPVLAAGWLLFSQVNPEACAVFLFGDVKGDDFVCTYPMSESFVPYRIAKRLNDACQSGELQGCVFLDFDADPPSVQVPALNMGMDARLFLTDLPVKGRAYRVPGLSPDDWIVTRNQQDFERLRQRFDLKGRYERIPLPFRSFQQIYRRVQ